MTDEQLTKKCAIAMGIPLVAMDTGELATIAGTAYYHKGTRTFSYDPLHDDAQAMALVKKFKLMITPDILPNEWRVDFEEIIGRDPDLNRAICECVAKLQAKP